MGAFRSVVISFRSSHALLQTGKTSEKRRRRMECHEKRRTNATRDRTSPRLCYSPPSLSTPPAPLNPKTPRSRRPLPCPATSPRPLPPSLPALSRAAPMDLQLPARGEPKRWQGGNLPRRLPSARRTQSLRTRDAGWTHELAVADSGRSARPRRLPRPLTRPRARPARRPLGEQVLIIPWQRAREPDAGAATGL